jgi:hypothetical protein
MLRNRPTLAPHLALVCMLSQLASGPSLGCGTTSPKRSDSRPALSPTMRAAFADAAEGKGGLTREAIQQTISRHSRRFKACRRDAPGFYHLRVTVAPSGAVQAAQPLHAPTRANNPRFYAFRNIPAGLDGGKDPSSPTNRCLAEVMKTVRFPPFKAAPQVFTYPFVVR